MLKLSIVPILIISALVLLSCASKQKVVDRTPEDFLSLPMPEMEESTKESPVFDIKHTDIPAFIEFVGKRGWYAHKIISVDSIEKELVVRDGINHEFTLNFDFAEQHLRQDHHLSSYINEMGLYKFLIFVMENNLYEHEIGPVNPQDEVVLIYGDRDTEFATEFYMTFEKIINHMQNDHRWTNQELLNADYCKKIFMYPEIDSCIKMLSE